MSSFLPGVCCPLPKAIFRRVQLLGRADSVRDFVRKGSPKGMVEITLSSGQSRPTVIKRHMSASDNKSTWLLNGEDVGLEHLKPERLLEKPRLELLNSETQWFRSTRRTTGIAQVLCGMVTNFHIPDLVAEPYFVNMPRRRKPCCARGCDWQQSEDCQRVRL